MKKTLWLIDKLSGHRLAESTRQHLMAVNDEATRKAQAQGSAILEQLAHLPGPHVELGETSWGQMVLLPLELLIKSHSVLSGGTGSGKSRSILLILNRLIDVMLDDIQAGQPVRFSFSLVDPKSETVKNVLFLISHKCAQLPEQIAQQLLQRLGIIDFSSVDPITPYDFAKPWTDDCDLDFFAESRAETLSELFTSGEGFSVRGILIIKFAIKLLAETEQPFSVIERLLSDELFRQALLDRAKSEEVRNYFRSQFLNESKATIAAVRVRLSSTLLGTQSLRLALSGNNVPDYRRIQDEGGIALINAGGANISRPTRQIVQSFILSDYRQSIFTRKNNLPHLVIVDEAQALFRTAKLRENMDELLRLSRSFGTYFCLATQNVSAAVQDTDLQEVLYGNIKWSFSLRSTPRDAAFLAPALPLTGRLEKPRTNPYVPAEYHSLNEERTVRLNGMANLPDRVGWIWLKAWTAEAIKLKTATIDLPEGSEFTETVERLRADPKVGQRVSRAAFLTARTEQEGSARQEENLGAATAEQDDPDDRLDLLNMLKQQYRAGKSPNAGGNKDADD